MRLATFFNKVLTAYYVTKVCCSEVIFLPFSFSTVIVGSVENMDDRKKSGFSYSF